MKKYVKDITLITQLSSVLASQVTSFQRSSLGVDINGTAINMTPEGWSIDSSLLTKLNRYGTLLYAGTKKVPLLPESETSNTFMTSNGLIGVFYTRGSNKYLTILDLFDNGNFPYNEIIPIDGSILEEYVLDINPEYKRIFVAYKEGENDFFKTANQKVYEELTFSYFQSQMDFNLPTDDYGYYKILTSSFLGETEEFSFFKKQFYLIEGPADLVVYYFDGTNYVVKAPVEAGTNLYWFPNLAIDSDNNIIKFKFKSETSNYDTIIVY
jgi:hypothetical protein